ncbi:U3 small nucleolar RNA-interacting protein 2 [Smittium culicis]|uniref:U3 small nucleolar RNA-interacting protein 2 n=1 Tax=Smittium culicis TaxID=133412 RepID=A0A1R1XGI4_9FUNG|nr:U3 small nucleolar RNA-interacting protein 2 [Smittium culicis]OMJ08110.1 U3 small nucleolar RNA-interacting protein 2 [Smittium culicis]OMJ13730.1 U3 small nucleolar RNA-interacting protein 2 [Smittium culicis]
MAKDKFLSKPVGEKKGGFSGKRKNFNQNQGRLNKKSKSQQIQTKRKSNEEDNDDFDQVGVNADYDDSASDSEADNFTDESDSNLETETEKRLRIAKEYVSNLRKDAEDMEADAEQIDKDLISSRLQQDVDDSLGKMHKRIADSYKSNLSNLKPLTFKNAHHLSVTCVEISPDGKYLYSGSKDNSLVKWSLELNKRIKSIKGQKKGGKDYSLGHCDSILCMAISSDGKFLATGSKDRLIHIWDASTMEYINTFRQHKDSVTGLAFRKGHNQLYSCSMDRMVKLWNVDERAFIETLYGHQDSIGDICTIQREQAITVGSRDKSARVWKIIDETQLVFRAGVATEASSALASTKNYQVKEDDFISLPGEDSYNEEDVDIDSSAIALNAKRVNRSVVEAIKQYKKDLELAKERSINFVEMSVEAVSMLDEETFVTGGDSGAISLWSFSKKKPIFTFHIAHGIEQDGPTFYPRSITTLASLPLSDLFVSGSYDGYIKIWKVQQNKYQGFSLINTIPVLGYINKALVYEHKSPNRNSLVTTANPISIVAAVGQEHKLGRWNKVKSTKNCIKVFRIEPELKK